jgi:hypothetical protein
MAPQVLEFEYPAGDKKMFYTDIATENFTATAIHYSEMPGMKMIKLGSIKSPELRAMETLKMIRLAIDQRQVKEFDMLSLGEIEEVLQQYMSNEPYWKDIFDEEW